jgi:hypothetical protein
MSSVASATTPMVVDFRDRDHYTVRDSTGPSEGSVAERRVNERALNAMLAPYGLQATSGEFRSADGFSLSSTSAAVVTNFSGPPALPNVAGPADHAGLNSRLGDFVDGGDGALMWLAMSELAYTSIRDMKDAKDVKHAMQKGKIEAKQAQITAEESKIAAERAEAQRAFTDSVVTAVVICAVSCAVAGATSGAANAATSTTDKAINAAATALPGAVGNIYSTYANAQSKMSGPQRDADEAKLKAMRWDKQAEMMTEMVEEAQGNYEEAKELFKLALNILRTHAELQTQATQSITRS